jgi:CRP-like cAMP-binding protein
MAVAADSPALVELMIRHIQASSAQSANLAGCNASHGLDARVCRWLMMAFDRTGETFLPVNHLAIGMSLGVRGKTTLVAALRRLRSAGIILHDGEGVRILDRRAADAVSCECRDLMNEMRLVCLDGFPMLR